MFKIDPEVKALTKGDLPEDAKPIIDEIAMQTEKLAESLYQQFSSQLDENAKVFQETLDKNAEQVKQDLDVLVEQVNNNYGQLQAKVIELSQAISAVQQQISTQQGPAIDTSQLTLKNNQLESVITEQRSQLETVRKGLAGSVAKLVKTQLPIIP